MEEFWGEAEADHEFRVNCTDHAEFRKFKRWFQKRIEEARSDPKSYEEKVVEKFGPFETFSDYDKEYKIDDDYVVLRHSRKDFNDAKWKPKTKLDEPFQTGKKMDEKYRIS